MRKNPPEGYTLESNGRYWQWRLFKQWQDSETYFFGRLLCVPRGKTINVSSGNDLKMP